MWRSHLKEKASGLSRELGLGTRNRSAAAHDLMRASDAVTETQKPRSFSVVSRHTITKQGVPGFS